MEASKLNTKAIFICKVAAIQRNLKAPKSQRNNFGKYNYRNCEDILNAANGLLEDLVLTLSDDIQLVGDRVYVKATATITDGEHELSNTSFAREALTKKGMDESQITGAASSYARKYALNGLFCIDDTKDSDHQSIGAGVKIQEPDDTAKQWIAAVNEDPKALEQITDNKYKTYIQSLIKG
jgi:hypothetical protein